MNLFSKNLLTLAFALSALFFSGCATKRGEVALLVPISMNMPSSNGKQIYINSVTDERVFEIKPSEPNIPSLDPSNTQGDNIKARAIARKRNSYGMALSDILLSEHQSVSGIVESSLKEALEENGFEILDNKSQVSPQTYIADIQIVKFWSWMNPGFWAITISCEVETKVDLHKEGVLETYNIHTKTADTFQKGNENNYKAVIQKALQAYIEDAKIEIR